MQRTNLILCSGDGLTVSQREVFPLMVWDEHTVYDRPSYGELYQDLRLTTTTSQISFIFAFASWTSFTKKNPYDCCKYNGAILK